MTISQALSINTLSEYPIPAAQVTALKKTDIEDALAAGVMYICGGKITPSNNTGVFQLSNPVGSGKNLYVLAFYLTSDTTIDARFIKNATVATPSPRTPDPLNLSGVASIAQVSTGVTGVTGGANFSPTALLLANTRTTFPVPLIIPPGSSVAVTFTTAALATVNCYSSCVWYEA